MNYKFKVEHFQSETQYSSAQDKKDELKETGKSLADKIFYFLATLSLDNEILEHSISYSKLEKQDGNIILSAMVSAKFD